MRDNTEAKYGVSSTALLPDIRERQIATRIKNYGVEFPFQSSRIQEQCNNTIRERYEVTRWCQSLINPTSLQALQNKDWLNDQHIIQRKTLTQIAIELGVADTTVGNYMRMHDLPTREYFVSTGEKELRDLLLMHDVTALYNKRDIISPLELDLYIPEQKIALEYCGLYWHSELHRDRLYHLKKLEQCIEQGIRLLTIYEDEWLDHKAAVTNKILHTLGKSVQPSVYGRECQAVSISSREFEELMETHHIQGSGPASIKIGLKHNGDLVAAMGFIKQANGAYVLNRYATSKAVIGGFTKLLSHFQRNHNWTQIVSFADRRWSDGSMYTRCGFTLDAILPPDYTYVVKNTREHKFNFRHAQLAKRLEHYNPSLSEVENCHNHGLFRIFNCGLLRYTLTKE